MHQQIMGYHCPPIERRVGKQLGGRRLVSMISPPMEVEVMLLLLVVAASLLQVCKANSIKMLATKTTLDTFTGTTGFAITVPDSGFQFEGISVCLRFSLFECLDFQPLFGNSQFVLYQSGRHGLGVMDRKVGFL